MMRRALFIALSLALLAVGDARAAPAATTASAPASRRADAHHELRSFGVRLPPTPAGFEQVRVLGTSMISGQIAAWQRIDPDAPADNEDTHKQRERIILFWRPLGMHFREGVRDAFRESAINPSGKVRWGEGDFVETAKQVDVPHETRLPTLRFERPDGTPDARGLARTEAVAANNLVYVLIHSAPKGVSPEVRAAFDHIAAGLSFGPPATLGSCLHLTQPRRIVPGYNDITICLPESFRGGYNFPSATAWDLTLFTHRPEDDKDQELEDYIIYQYFAESDREIPEEWLKGIGDPKLKGRPAGWISDAPDLRVATPLPKQSHGRVAFVGGKKLTERRWLWIVMFVPPRVIADAGGAANVAKALEATVRTAELSTKDVNPGGPQY